MKKLGILLLAAAFAIFGLMTFAACNEETLGPGDDPIVTPEPVDLIDGVSYAVMEYVGTSAEVYIPSTYQGLPVTSIGDRAFSRCSSLTSITIPDSVTSIGEWAFSGCDSLTSIIVDPQNSVYHSDGNCLIETESKTLIAGCKTSVIPSDGSVISIGDYAFSGCSGLTSVTIPDSVTSIGYAAFRGCDSLESVTIPDSVTSIGVWAFSGCSSLESVTIPDSVTSIGYGAFSGCSSLESVTIPDSVTSIGYGAFVDCSSLTSVTIGDSVTSIGDYAFAGCSSLTSIIVDPQNSVYHSDGNCLIETESKTLIAGCGASVIPADGSVISIGDSAFSSCYSLTSIVIPDSVTSIGSSAFNGCDNLTSIVIPDSVTSIGDYAFYDCDSLETVYYRGSEEEWNEIEIGADNDDLLNAEIVFNYKGE